MTKTLPRPLDRNLYWIAVLPLLLIPLGLLLGFPGERHGGGAGDYAGFALIVAGFVAFCIAVGSRFHGVMIKDEADLDERELGQRYRTSNLSYRIFFTAMMFGCGYMYFGPRIGAPTPAGSDWVWVMFLLGYLFLLLPIIILEWSRDPVLEEDEG